MPNPRLWLLQVGLGYSLALGSGLVVARGAHGAWSPPSALSFASVGWGLQAGGALHDLLIVLRNRSVCHAFHTIITCFCFTATHVTIRGCSLVCSCGLHLWSVIAVCKVGSKCMGHATGVTCWLLFGAIESIYYSFN